MSITIDFSNWAKTLFEYSLQLISNKEVLEYNELSRKIQFSKEYQDKQKELVKELLEAHLYWVGLGVGVECLAKSILIKHEVMSINKRNISDKIPSQKTSFNSYQELRQYRVSSGLDDIHKVYQYALSTNISVNSNPWIEQQFKCKDINHLFEINTPTLGVIYNSEIKKLLDKKIISQAEFTLLNRSLELFTVIRRNMDSHIFLKQRIVGSINHDIENVYIPMVNLLINIYNR